MIGGVSQVVIEVEDQERAKAFWTKTMAFEVAQDARYGQERWLEGRTPDKAVVVVVLDVRTGPRPTPRDPSLPTSNVFFHTDDLQQTHKELTARWVQFPLPPSSGPLAGGRCSPAPMATAWPWWPANRSWQQAPPSSERTRR